MLTKHPRTALHSRLNVPTKKHRFSSRCPTQTNGRFRGSFGFPGGSFHPSRQLPKTSIQFTLTTIQKEPHIFKTQNERNIKSEYLHKGVKHYICPGRIDIQGVIAFNILEILVFLENFGKINEINPQTIRIYQKPGRLNS